MKIKFLTKAETLFGLRKCLQSAKILPLYFFTVQEWQQDKNRILASLKEIFEDQTLIVRSSALNEDTVSSSNAGAYKSIQNVSGDQLSNDQLSCAIIEVIESYGAKAITNQLLVQPMLQNVLSSGVAFSHDPNNGSPYRIINWHCGTDTSFVTTGSGGRIWRQTQHSKMRPPEEISSVIPLLEELREHFDDAPLDIEFAVTAQGTNKVLWLLQCRPLVMLYESETADDQTHRLQNIYDKIKRGMRPMPFLLGNRTVYGVMPDWNPAEIIGLRPKPLALSLYRELITDSIWAYQRHNYGYRNLRSYPLMPHFFGLPYIDVRLSFNSFIPADLDNDIAEKLVNYYVDRLLAEPNLHDKIEFEIVFSCYTLDLPEKLERLSDVGFSKQERLMIGDSLRKLTNNIIHQTDGLWKADAKKLDTLQARHKVLQTSDANSIEKIYWLIEDCKRYGTLPFAGLARAGFIAVQMLKSLVSTGIFSEDDYNNFIAGTQTISGRLTDDRIALDRTDFLKKYGHLRPGTYNIQSPRYDEAPDIYFDWHKTPLVREKSAPFALTLPQMRGIRKLLEEHRLVIEPVELLNFMQTGIEMREMAKFYFSRNLSDAISLIAEVGGDLGLPKEDLAYSSFDLFKELYIGASDMKATIESNIAHGKRSYAQTVKTILPTFISKPEDIWAFETHHAHPNFITQKRAVGRIRSHDDAPDLDGAIIFIPNADPGFDWIFSYPIAGLVTAWGGVNSHMAIRAGELSIPAIIGAGEVLYDEWSSARRIMFDCAEQKVEVVA